MADLVLPVFRRGPYLDVTNSRKSLFDVPMIDTGKLPTPQNLPMRGEYSSTPSYSLMKSCGQSSTPVVSSLTYKIKVLKV